MTIPRLILLLAALACATPALANLVVVLNSRDASVTLLDRDSGAEKAVIPVGKEPHHLIATPDGRELIVASAVGNELIFLDAATGKVTRRLPNVPDPYHLAFSFEAGKGSDGVVALDIALPPSVQAEATRKRGFIAEHTGVLQQAAFLEYFKETLARIPPAGQ